MLLHPGVHNRGVAFNDHRITMFPRYVICGDGKWNPIILNFVTRADMLPSSRSEREPGSPTRPGVFSWAFLWLSAHLLMELNRCDLMDTVLLQTNSTSLPASTTTGAKKWKILHRLFSRQKQKHKQSLWIGDRMGLRMKLWVTNMSSSCSPSLPTPPQQ